MKVKKRNPQDTTLRNNAARKKEVAALDARCDHLEQCIDRLTERMKCIEDAAKAQTVPAP